MLLYRSRERLRDCQTERSKAFGVRRIRCDGDRQAEIREQHEREEAGQVLFQEQRAGEAPGLFEAPEYRSVCMSAAVDGTAAGSG